MYGDGSTARDYTYIDDIVNGFILSIPYLESKEKVYEIINLGSSQPVSLKEMIALLYQTFDQQPKIIQRPLQQGDVIKTFANIQKAQNLLGYSPKFSFAKGISHFARWYRQKNSAKILI